MLYDILVKKSIIEEGVCIMAKILIVDDEPRIRELIREHLQYSGYICEEAADGTAALTQLSGGAFDLVILDLMMPFMDGMTCLREMRALWMISVLNHPDRPRRGIRQAGRPGERCRRLRCQALLSP